MTSALQNEKVAMLSLLWAPPGFLHHANEEKFCAIFIDKYPSKYGWFKVLALISVSKQGYICELCFANFFLVVQNQGKYYYSSGIRGPKLN